MCCRCSENREFWLSRILKFLKLISGCHLRKKRRIKFFGEWCISKVRGAAHPTRTTTIKLVCSIGMQVPIKIRGLAFLTKKMGGGLKPRLSLDGFFFSSLGF
jgi:hypothetical protein